MSDLLQKYKNTSRYDAAEEIRVSRLWRSWCSQYLLTDLNPMTALWMR
jgi:hypothetical protein